MKEELFKRIIIIFLLNFCFPFNLGLYDFVYPDITPISISKNSLGVRTFEVDEESRIFFQTQNSCKYSRGAVSCLYGTTKNRRDL